jgi:hypothetical protein
MMVMVTSAGNLRLREESRSPAPGFRERNSYSRLKRIVYGVWFDQIFTEFCLWRGWAYVSTVAL